MPHALNGLRVVSFESRRSAETAELIRNYGGEPIQAPAMREVALEDAPNPNRRVPADADDDGLNFDPVAAVVGDDGHAICSVLGLMAFRMQLAAVWQANARSPLAFIFHRAAVGCQRMSYR
jgi:hypothetical protein